MNTKFHQRWGDNNMDNNERYEKGSYVMNELFSEEVQTGMRNIQKISPDFWDMIVSSGFGDLYARNTLTMEQREYITLTTLITQGAFDQLGVHIQAALNIGLTQEEIIEIIIHCTGYVGFPKAIQAMGIAGEIFKEYELNNTKV